MLGASGSGKSTLLQALAGVLGAGEGEQAGQLHVDGVPPRPGRAGLVLQDPDSQVILPRLGDDVAFGCENLGVPQGEIWERVHAALSVVGLGFRLDHSTTALSGGEKQRLALAGVLAMRPGLLLLDEPTANLDPAGVAAVTAAVAAAAADSGATLVIVEHRVATWLPDVNRVVVLAAGGGVMADGPPERVLLGQHVELAAAGVWLPHQTPVLPARDGATTHTPLMVTKQLAVGRSGRTVWAGPDMAFSAGELTALTGPNGVGKSTLALTLAGLLTPTCGTVEALPPLADGLVPDPKRWRSRKRISRIGVVFQNPEHQFLAPTVEQELAIGLRVLGYPQLRARQLVERTLDRLRLSRLAQANPFTLSGGEQRRLSAATALITTPKLLILDEPTFGQDARTWMELVGLLRDAADEGSAVVVVSHDADLVAIADRSLQLAAGVGAASTVT